MEACAFLKQKYPNLHLSPEVQAARRRTEMRTGKKLSDKPVVLIQNYLDRLGEFSEHIPELCISHKLLAVQVVFKNRLVRPESIPAKAFESDLKLAEQYGRGKLKKTPEYIRAKSGNIVRDQIRSLVVWIDFLFSNELDQPLWAKYWVLRSVLGMGAYDPSLGVFNERTESTYEAFPSLDKEVVIKIMKAVVLRDRLKYSTPGTPIHGHLTGSLQGLLNGEARFEQLVESGHFAKIYAQQLGHKPCSLPQNLSNIEGEWVKYPQGSDPEPLVKAIHSYPVEWCTRNESVASNQLARGDFWVYFTTQHANNRRYPRLAIRMEGSERVEEARGAEKKQIVDVYAMPVLEAKLKEFGENGEKFAQKYIHVRILTAITEKYRSGQTLSREDLRFLYEVDEKIDTCLDVVEPLWDELMRNRNDDDFDFDEDGFRIDLGRDPRIEEIIGLRNRREDLAYIFDCRPEQIALCQDEAFQEGMKYYAGDLAPENTFSPVGLFLPETVGGKLDLSSLKTLEGLQLPKFVGQDLILDSVAFIDEAVFPEHVGGDLLLKNLVEVNKIRLPRYVGGNLRIGSLVRFGNKLELPATVAGDIDLRRLLSAEGLKMPAQHFEDINLDSIESAKGLCLPSKLYGALYINKLSSTEDLVLPSDFKGRLNLNGLKSGKGLRLPQQFNGSLCLKGIVSPKDLKLPQSVQGSLYLSGLQSAVGLVLPKQISGTLCLSGLESAKGLQLPKKLNGRLDLSGLVSAKHLKFPPKVSYGIRLTGLKNTHELVLPRKLASSIDLSGLTSAEGLKLPQSIEGSLTLDGLTRLENFCFSTRITGSISLSNLVTAKNVRFPKEATSALRMERLVQAENITFPTNIRGDLNLKSLFKVQNITWPRRVRNDLHLDSMTDMKGVVLPMSLNGCLFFGPHSENRLKHPYAEYDDLGMPF